MRIIISYPPLQSEKGTPLLGQNRQFQWFNNPTYIYPVVPATAATLLKENGFDVIWNDAIAEQSTYQEFVNFMKEKKPDLIAFETKTPVVEAHWKIIDDLKKQASEDWQPSIALMGDHVTALPEESFKNSKVDFVVTGGDYDFLLLSISKYLESKNAGETPPELEPGIWYRDNNQIKNTGQFKLEHDLNKLPFIDRELTKWELYAKNNGNYKRTPGTYTMAGRDCWHGKCTFCAWTTTYPKFRARDPENVLDEIGHLIDNYQVKEIMDDTGAFPPGKWLRKFCNGMIERGYNKKVLLDCNMRFGALSFDDYKLMKKAGFRLLLFGLESANQNTLDKVDKKLTREEIIDSCKLARKAGIYPHITIMFGYPWESYDDACKTLELGKYLLKKGIAYTVQATIVIPYPGTPLFKECKENGLLKTLDWSRYDMREPVMKSSIPNDKIQKLVQGIYNVSLNPEFLMRRVLSVRDFNDVAYFARAGSKVLGHLLDFKPREKSVKQ